MFAVMLAAVFFMSSAAPGSSTADFCAASLPPLVGGEDKCSGLGDSELVNEIKQNVSALLPGVVRCMLPGRTPEYPANSCAELANGRIDIPSGNYWILNSTQSPVEVFCEMGEVFPSGLNATGGWVRVANLNMTDPEQQCPQNLQLSYTDQPIRLCGRGSVSRGCDSVIFTTYGVQYRQVCGRVRGYQYRSPDAFDVYACPQPCTIDNPYVDGISITHGSPRKHIWTYANGITENNNHLENCPCTGSGAPPPAFVGSDYYCESGLSAHGVIFSTLMTHCGMDKIAMDMRLHAVILQISLGSVGNFLSQLLTTWSFASVETHLYLMRILPLTLFNSTFSEL